MWWAIRGMVNMQITRWRVRSILSLAYTNVINTLNCSAPLWIPHKLGNVLTHTSKQFYASRSLLHQILYQRSKLNKSPVLVLSCRLRFLQLLLEPFFIPTLKCCVLLRISYKIVETYVSDFLVPATSSLQMRAKTQNRT